MANLYTVENLLMGRTYKSDTLEGKIVGVQQHDYFHNRNTESYLVEVNTGTFKNKFRVVVVAWKELDLY